MKRFLILPLTFLMLTSTLIGCTEVQENTENTPTSDEQTKEEEKPTKASYTIEHYKQNIDDDNEGSFEGISHFMGNPMQGVSNLDGYVKVDYVDTNVGEIFGDIIDLTDLSDDIMYDIGSNRNMILGGAADVIGIFRDEKQQVAAENIRKKGSNLGFKPFYLQDNPEHKKEFIKTLADWEVEYNSSKKLQSSNTAQQ